MPRIYEPRVGLAARLSYIPDNSLQELGGFLSAVAKKKAEDNFAIDISNFQMKQIQEIEKIQNSGSHDTASKQDLVGGSPVEGGIIGSYMKSFNDGAYEIERKYGEKGKQAIADYRVRQFGQITNLYSSIKSQGDINWFEDSVKTREVAVKNGSATFDDMHTGSLSDLDALSLNPQQREYARQLTSDRLSYAMFENDMSTNPLLAVRRLSGKASAIDPGYIHASFSTIDRMNNDLDRYIDSRAMSEVQRANQSTQDSFGHKPDMQLLNLAKERGRHDVVGSLTTSYSLNNRVNEATSNDLMAAKSAYEAQLVSAYEANDSAKKADAQMMLGFINKRAELVYSEPDLVASQEGIPVPEYDIRNPESLISAKRDIRKSLTEKQNTKTSLFGSSTSKQLIDYIKSAPNDQRPGALSSYTQYLTGVERKDAIRELGTIDPLFGVAVSLTPVGGVPSVKDQNLMADVMGDSDPTFKPPKESSVDIQSHFLGVNYGDPAAIGYYIKAAENVYARRAQREGWKGYDSDNIKSILNELTGQPIKFGASKTISFKDSAGNWVDPDDAEDALDYAAESGLFKAFTPDGVSIESSQMKKYGLLVPSGDEGVYYMSQNDGRFFLNENKEPLMVDLKDIINNPRKSVSKRAVSSMMEVSPVVGF